MVPTDTWGSNYAVIEWGGEVWYSETAPLEGWIQQGEQPFRFWAWNSDGTRIAYYNPSDAEGYLYVSDVNGDNPTKLFPKSAYWLLPGDGFLTYPIEPPSTPLLWSQDGKRLVTFGYGNTNHPCPTLYSSPKESSDNVPCWQVVDPSNGTIIWTMSDSARGLMPSLMPLSELFPWTFYDPAISPDGKYLMLQGWIGVRRSNLIFVDTGEVKGTFDWEYTYLRWGAFP